MDILYSYGGGEILHKVFNGIAMLTKSDSPYFTNVVYISALIGGVWAAAKALPGGKLGFFASRWFIPSYLFLSVFLIPKTTVHIVDEVDPSYRADNIDNVPLGLALVASVSSSFAKALTDSIEDIFVPNSQHKSAVPIFAAKLLSEARYVRIADPTLRKNVKEFARQCFRLPFILTNMKGLRQEALETNDMLKFIQTNAHPWLGVYWETPEGSIEFLSCKQACPKIKAAMAVEGEQSLGPLLTRAFGWSTQGSEKKLSHDLKLMAQDVWSTIAKQTGKASRALEQQLMINAYREARDDKKTEFGIDRLSPELLSYSATRVTAQQNTGFLIKTAIAGSYMPMLQAVVFSLLMIVSLIILPLSFLPGGFGFLREWVKMVIAVQLWPVFSAIINGIAYMAHQKASASVLGGLEGFSIATQTGLADAAYDVSAWMSSLQLSLPFLSWAFVSRSGIALTQMMSSFSGGFEAGAAKIGSETADGNITFDTQTFRNQSMGNVQYAQQQWAANTNQGSTYDDGKIAITTSVYGQQAANVRQDMLTTNMSSNDNIAAQAAQNHTDTQTLVQNQARSLSTSLSDRASTTLSLVQSASKGLLAANDVSQSENTDIQKRAEQTQGLLQQYGEQHGISAQTMSEMAVNLKSGNTWGGKILQGALGLEASGGLSASASNQEQFNQFKNSEIGQRIAENVGMISSYAEQHKASITDATGQQAAEQFSAAHDKVQTASEQLQKTQAHAENWAKVQSLAENQSFVATTNENADWINFVAEQTGLDRGAAVQLIERGGSDVDHYRSDFTATRTEALSQFVGKADHVLTDQEIGEFLSSSELNLKASSLNDAMDKIGQAGFKSESDLQQNYERFQKERQDQKSIVAEKIDHQQGAHHDQWAQQEHQHLQEHEKSNIRRMGDKGWDDLKATASGVVKDFESVTTDHGEKLQTSTTLAMTGFDSYQTTDAQTADVDEHFEKLNEGIGVQQKLSASDMKKLQDSLEQKLHNREQPAEKILKDLPED